MRLVEQALGLTLLVAIGLATVNVGLRYLFATSFDWVEEVLALLFTGWVFLGMPLVALRGEHIALDLLSARLSPRAVRGLHLFAVAVAAIVLAVATYGSFIAVRNIARFGQQSVVAGIPSVIPHGIVLTGIVSTLVIALFALFALIRGARGAMARR
ncbi:MAG TPA: TRAP transporter small permease subunit [Burkholderiaceae bacterium]|nr:TRAP transporter small permease subunit [Burkholderiaceae bacterium]